MHVRVLNTIFAAMLFACLATMSWSSTADASPRRAKHYASQSESSDWMSDLFSVRPQRASSAPTRSSRRSSSSDSSWFASPRSSGGLGARPSAWCGWYMRSQLGGGPEYNLASNWRRYGSPSSPHVGAVVVWPHHVGMITGQSSNGQWIVKSGNYSNRVHEGPRSLAGATIRG